MAEVFSTLAAPSVSTSFGTDGRSTSVLSEKFTPGAMLAEVLISPFVVTGIVGWTSGPERIAGTMGVTRSV